MPGPGDLCSSLKEKCAGLVIEFTGHVMLEEGGEFVGKVRSGQSRKYESLEGLREGLGVIWVR